MLETRYPVNQETDPLVTKAMSRACQYPAPPGAENERPEAKLEANRGSENGLQIWRGQQPRTKELSLPAKMEPKMAPYFGSKHRRLEFPSCPCFVVGPGSNFDSQGANRENQGLLRCGRNRSVGFDVGTPVQAFELSIATAVLATVRHGSELQRTC